MHLNRDAAHPGEFERPPHGGNVAPIVVTIQIPMPLFSGLSSTDLDYPAELAPPEQYKPKTPAASRAPGGRHAHAGVAVPGVSDPTPTTLQRRPEAHLAPGATHSPTK